MAKANYKTIELAPKYIPKKSEPYMCPEHLAYFYQLLTAQKEEIMRQNTATLNSMSATAVANSSITGDEFDSASTEQETTMTLRMAERDNNLLAKINSALDRIENGTFGYSVISGDEIGLSRMLARPLATMTIEEQEEHEKKEL
ncbi:MAG: hypothetical protein J6Y07_01315 [Alphaproteobacteria bacterium]|nr:hypothetical protein [Alphaproteobacteria bacterium]